MDTVLLSDPVVTEIPVEECGEPLVDLRSVTALRLDDRLANRDGYHCRLRVGVVDRLVTAQALLAPGLRLLVVKGHGPTEPHVSGAAVDLTLCSVDGGELWLGTEVNDTDDPACHMVWSPLNRDAVANRHRLSRALSGAGLVNYPNEWWHWSYGDRYWAYATKAPAARYGAAALGHR